jgi:C-terminal processing protease CtpA/Prc
MRRIAIALTFLLALPLVAADRIEHLAKLADLWATVKYLDPQMMTRTVDWDGALVRAIPKVREAKTDAEFAAAVGSMLAELHDPATTVTKPDTDAAAKKLVDIPLTRMDGEVLIVNLGPYAKAGGSIWSSMSAVAAEIGKAKRVVIDLRGDEGVGEVLSSIGLVGGTTPVPASFWAFHSGYQPQEGSTSGGYYSALQLVAATPLQKPPYQQTPVPLRIVFITEGKQLADAAAALWWSGAAAIVSEAPLTDDTLAGTSPVELGDGWIATLRVAQPAMRGLTADAVVPGAEAALARAMALARGDAPYSARPPMTPVTLTATRVLEAPYAEMPYPDLPYRLLSLFRLWTIIDRFYPYKHLIGDWDAVLRTMIPRFEGAKDEKEYAAAVMETVAFIEDGHSGAYGHPATWSLVGGLWLPAVQLRVVEQQYVVMQPVPDVLKRGDVVMAVDGEPLRDREQRLRKYITASMERPRTQRILNSVLRGEKDSEAVLTVRNHDGSTREVRVKRDQRFVPQPQNTEPTYRVLDGNIGYADLTRLTTPEVDAMFEALGKTKAIVFDMRGYPRGTAWSIAPRLNTNKAKYGASFRRSQLSAWSPEEGRSGFYFDQPLPPTDPKKPLYTGPTAMLIDDRAISQSEHSGLFYEAANGTTFIGSPSAGANGDVTSFPQPGGFTVAFTGHDVRHADGRQLQRVGLVPHIAVEPTIRGLRQGKDEVLERAIAWANEVTRSK